MKTATLVKELTENFKGNARLYKLSEKVAWDGSDSGETDYVVVSATVAMFSGPETYIFPANENGEVLNWGELDGSYRGGLNHEQALTNAGFEVAR